MKTKVYFCYFFTGNLSLIFSLIFLFTSCKKEAAPGIRTNVSTFKSTSAKSDGIITVQTGILPPVTLQSFIPNTGSSVTEFQIVASQHIFLYETYFTATYPLIEYITIENYGVGSVGGNIEFNGGRDISAGSGISLHVKIYYTNADSSTSGSTAQLSLTNIVYRTDDEVYHSFFAGTAGKAQTMCIVNNIPHITFHNPAADELNNGFKEIAELQLTGDTSWTLNSLPLNLSSPFDAVITKTQLIVKSHGKIMASNSDSVELNAGCSTQTVINFTGGLHHEEGKTDILKIYAPVSGSGYNVITTAMAPLSSFVWTDGLGAKINGAKNNKFFKEQTGQSHFQ